MSLARPSLTALNVRVRVDFDTRLEGADSRLRRNSIDVFAGAHAATADGLHSDIASRARFFPATDAPEANARWASLKGVIRKAAVAATATATLTGTDGLTAEAGTILVRRDGLTYRITADATIAAGTAEAAIVAVDGGVATSIEIGQELTFQSPVAGISATALVSAAGLGEDEESEADFCGRIEEVLRAPAAGGKEDDYVRWAKEVAGVTRAWVEANWDGLGTVRVSFVMDGREDIIPEAGDVAAVDAVIQAVRPVTADVTVIALTPDPLAFTITPVPDTPAVRAAIAAELRDLISREAEPGGTILLSHIREAISIAAGETDYVMAAPTASVTTASGHISTMGAITWPS